MDSRKQEVTPYDLGYAFQAAVIVWREFLMQLQEGRNDATRRYSEHKAGLAPPQALATIPEPQVDMPEWELREIANGSF